jgi:type 1 fimbria pilin
MTSIPAPSTANKNGNRKNSMKKNALLFIPVLALAWSWGQGRAHAACEFVNSAQTANVTFSLPALTQSLNPSDISPQMLSTATLSSTDMASAMGVAAGANIWNDCSGSLVWKPLLAGVSGNSPVGSGFLSTGIDNLYLYLYAGNQTSGSVSSFSTPATDGTAWTRALGSLTSATPSWNDLGNVILVLYQAGRIRQGGVIPAGPVAALSVSDGLQLVNMNMSAITVNVLACTITTPVVNVTMPTMLKSVFTGTGTTSEGEDFSIGASCDSGVMPTITFSGQASSAGTDVFAINTGDKEATGLGIQLMYAGNAVEQNVAVDMGTTVSDGDVEFPFTARYVQTAEKVTAGSVNSTITFTLNYK